MCANSTDVGAEGKSEAEEAKAERDGELPPVLEKLVRPVVHDPRHQSLHVAELAVNPQHQEHHEEDGRPDDRPGQGEDEVGVGEEDEARAGVDDVVDGGAGDESHVAEDGEDEDASQQAGQCVHNACDDCVPERGSYN